LQDLNSFYFKQNIYLIPNHSYYLFFSPQQTVDRKRAAHFVHWVDCVNGGLAGAGIWYGVVACGRRSSSCSFDRLAVGRAGSVGVGWLNGWMDERACGCLLSLTLPFGCPHRNHNTNEAKLLRRSSRGK